MLENLYDYGKYTEKLGFYQNADTSNTLMNVYFDTYKNILPKVLEGMRKQIENFAVSGKVFMIEKEAVKNEVAKRNLSFDDLIDNYISRKVFSLDINRRIQTIKTTNKININDLLKFHNFIFSYGNVIITLYGKLPKKLEKKVINIISNISLNKRVKQDF
jgi:predicted Zn-dependent peptidase